MCVCVHAHVCESVRVHGVCVSVRVHGVCVCVYECEGAGYGSVHVFVRCVCMCVCVCERELMMSETQNFDESAMYPLHPNSPCGLLF